MTIHRCFFRNRALLISLSLVLLALALSPLNSVRAQSPPPHPRLLFRTTDLPQLATKVANPATIPGAYFARMATSVAGLPPLPTASTYTWVTREHLRAMQELAFRYQITGGIALGNSARDLLLQFIRTVPLPSNSTLGPGFGCAMALSFDWVYDRLSPAERREVVRYLELWVGYHMRMGPAGPLAAYSSASDDFSMRSATAVAFICMAIWEDSATLNPLNLIRQNLSKLRDGWMDQFSPDGSIDVSFEYAGFGPLFSINAGVAAINCGLGDYLAGTNALKCGRWLASASVADTFLGVGVARPWQRISRMDPIAFYAIGRTADEEALWFYDRDFDPTIAGTLTDKSAFSPLISIAVHYPVNLFARQPLQASAFFRDNLNFPNLRATKFGSNPAVGQGGHAYLHNSADSTWTRFGAYYNIRDEWVTHGHEDDGHFSLSSGGRWHYIEDPRSSSGGQWWGWRAENHNIVTAQGAPLFRAPPTNPYSPPAATPATFGSFGGRKEVVFVGQDADYIQGRHDYTWQMRKARRGVLMIKDPYNPHVILIDNVDRDGTVQVYEERFNARSPCTGTGTAADPMVTSYAGQSIAATWLRPQAVTITPGTQQISPSASNPAFQNRVSATGIDATFISNHGPNTPTATGALVGPSLTTQGGTIQWPNTSEKILFRDDSTGLCAPGIPCLADQQTASDARLVWLEQSAGATTGWIAITATVLNHQGTSLLTANQQVNVCARNGRISIQTQDPETGPSLAATFGVGFPVSEVILNGSATAFVQTATQVFIGGGNLPNSSSDDRAYTFTNGWLGDAQATPAIIATGSGALSSRSGFASLRVKSGVAYLARPIAFAMDITLVSGARNRAAGFRIEQNVGSGDGFDLLISPSSSSAHLLEVQVAGVILGSIQIPLDVAGQSTARISAEYDRSSGSLTLLSPLGAQLQSHTLPPSTTPFFITALVSPDATIDNLSVFDSAEDGITPQGVAFFTNLQRIAGFALRAENLGALQEFRPIYRGAFLPQSVANLWLTTGGLQERSVLRHLPLNTPLPATLSEALFEWDVQSIPFGPHQATGLWIRTDTGQPLMGILAP